MRLMRTVICAAAALITTAGAVPAKTDDVAARKVIIIVADTATWEEYTSPAAPFLREWLAQCAVGLMNTRVAGLPTPPAGYLTLGASSRAAAYLKRDLLGVALGHDERYDGRPASSVFRARTGNELPPGGLGYLGLPAARWENEEATYPLRLGLMGEALRQAGLSAAAIGNADLPHSYRRHVAAIVMDEAGIVPLGDVGPRMYVRAPGSEPPLRTNYASVMAELKRVLPRASVVAVETGDLPRITERSEVMAPSRLRAQRLAAVARMDAFLQELAGLMRGQPWRAYVVAPSALSGRDQRRDLLTPIAAWGEDVPSGLLTSPSTRRLGLAANTDLAPSVLDFLGVPVPPDAIGRPMGVRMTGRGDAVAYVMRLQRQQERVEIARPYVLNRASALMVSLFVVAAAVLILAGPLPRGVLTALRQGALFVMALPLAMLALPGDVAENPAAAFLGVIGIAVAACYAAHALRRTAPAYAWLAGWFGLVLCTDVAVGQTLVHSSLLSYSATVGSRYYGLGNELGGVILAAAPIAASARLGARRLGRSSRLTTAVILAAVVIIIAHPAMGANIGIAISAALGFGLMVTATYSPRFGARRVILAAGIVAAAAAIIGGASWLFSGEDASHIGRGVQAIQERGIAEIATVLSRRLARNWLLVRHSSATWVLISALVVIAGAAMGRSRALPENAQAGSPLALALTGGGVAAVASFFLNDSGVASAAWGLTLIAATLQYAAFDWRLRQGSVRRE